MDYLLLGIAAGLAAVERKGFLQAMLSRPIALGPVMGWMLGDIPGGVMLAGPLELLWLGAVNLGAALPVHETLGVSAIAGGAILAGRELGSGVTPAVAVLAVLLCAPMALLGRKADRLTEIVNEWLSARALTLLERGDSRAAVRENLYGLALPFGISFCLAPAGAAVASRVIPPLLRTFPASGPLGVGWVALAAFSCAVGATTLRARSSTGRSFLLTLGVGIFAALLFWGSRT